MTPPLPPPVTTITINDERFMDRTAGVTNTPAQGDDPQSPSTIAVRLPTEVLLQIFCYSTEEGEEQGPEDSATTAFTISQVCHRWREVAIDYPLLWTKLSFRSETMIATMLERARQTPLSVCVDLTPGSATRPQATANNYRFASACVALENISRVREICLHSVSCDPLQNVVKLFRPTASRLERLELRTSEMRNTTGVFKVDKAFWSQAAMRLQKLVLESVHFDNASLNLVPRHCQTLTHLELRRMSCMRVVDVMAMIAVAAPTLETLILDYLPFRNLQPTTVTPVILPRLKRLQLGSIFSGWEQSTPVSVLQHIKYPDNASLVLQFTLTSLLTPNTVLPAVVAHLQARSPPPYRSVLLQTENLPRRPGLRLSAWTRAGAPDLFNLDEYPRPALDLHIVRDEDVEEVLILRALGELAVAAKFENVREATIGPVRPELPWAQFFRHMPIVRELSLYGLAAMHGFCAVFASSTLDAWPYVISETAGLFPHLTTLSVTGVTFREGYLKKPTKELDTLKTGLQNFEQVRGAQVEELVVCYCDTVTRDMEEIARSVKQKNVIWDGSERGTSSVPMPMVVEGLTSPEEAWQAWHHGQQGVVAGLGMLGVDEADNLLGQGGVLPMLDPMVAIPVPLQLQAVGGAIFTEDEDDMDDVDDEWI